MKGGLQIGNGAQQSRREGDGQCRRHQQGDQCYPAQLAALLAGEQPVEFGTQTHRLRHAQRADSLAIKFNGQPIGASLQPGVANQQRIVGIAQQHGLAALITR